MKGTKNIRIAIADDHAIMRDGMKKIINEFEGFEVCLEAANGEELLRALKSLPEGELPELCILDINMPEMDGYETMENLGRDYPAVNTLALSMYDHEFSIIKMMRLGAMGYLKKDADSIELHQALEVISKGGGYHPDVTAHRLSTKISAPFAPQLSGNETIFMGYCCEELTYREIAQKMNLSVRTVEGYRDSLFEKLKLKSRTGLVRYAIDTGLVVTKKKHAHK